MTHAVASGHALTSQAADQVLRDGGSAVDAVIAAALVAFVVEPVMAQPLGGGFLMHAPANGRTQVLDAFVQTPRKQIPERELDIQTITVDFGTDTQDFHIGAGTCAVPCLMPALALAHARAGRMPLKVLVGPAVEAARGGHPVADFQAEVAGLVRPILTADPAVAALYAPGGKMVAAGETLINRDLAEVLELFATEGPRFFTEGEVGQALAALPGGQVSAEDLRRAAPITRNPLTLLRRDHRVSLNPGPSLGGVQIALMLSALPDQPGPATIARAMAEVARLRRETGIDAVPDEGVARLLDPALVDRLTAILKHHKTSVRGTTHISAVDARGNGAALTLSNGEGCGRLLPGTGIMANNMLGEEDLLPDGPTSWTPDRRLASMMCPIAMTDRDGTLTMLGSGGSNRIRSALTTVLLGLIDEGLAPETAVDAPRMHVEGKTLAFEETGPEGRRVALLREWPEATLWDRPSMYFGGVHLARRTRRGQVVAAADARRAGTALTG